ncbi:glycosyl hydrolase [Halosolutus halophilus]|uniref:glycosyl hydrolase n=1 Tax=Halosolutus halophilus TaxID=1552990 RepID=UPI0022351807|nr:glycosyl hydrolase [Halosolutus halophilus]
MSEKRSFRASTDRTDDERTLPVSRRTLMKATAAGAFLGGSVASVAAIDEEDIVDVGSGSYTTTIPAGYDYDSPPTADTMYTTENVEPPYPSNGWASGLHFGYDPYAEEETPYSNGATVAYPYYAAPRAEGLRVQIPSTWQGWRDPWDDQEDEPAPIEEADFVRMDYEETPRVVLGHDAVSTFDDARTDHHGDWHVRSRWGDGTSTAMDVTMARGSPFIFAEYEGGGAELSLLDETDDPLDSANVAVFADEGNVLGLTVEPTEAGHSTQHFGVFAPAGAEWSGVGGDTLTSDLAGAGYLTIAVLPDGTAATLDEFEAYAYNVVRDTIVDWEYVQTDGNGDPVSEVHTTYSYSLEEKPESETSGTLAALLPTQWKHTDESFTSHTYWSPKGEMKVLAGSSFSTTLTYPGILPHLPDVGTYDGAQLDDYIQTLQDQYGPYTSQGVPECAYWASKDLMRNCTACGVADVRGRTDDRDYFLQAIRGRLSTYFDVRTNSWTVDGGTFSTEEGEELFYYHDDVGVIQSYPGCEFGGIDALNDHHFHYGYFVYAAAEVARLDPEWAADDAFGEMVELLIRDYANWERPDHSAELDPATDPKNAFPFLRTFEPYAGHSYAGGINGSAWGNNQESSSEAVNAYAAMIRWGEFTGNEALRDAGIFLYTHEINATTEYWFDHDEDSFPAGWGENLDPDELDTDGSGPFEYSPMVWDVGYWRTVYWDTSDPIETFGINWLPMAGHTLYLGHDQDYAESNWTRLIEARDAIARGPGGDSNWPDGWQQTAWGYRAMTDSQHAVDMTENGVPIEPAGSSTPFVYHFVHCLNELGAPDPSVVADAPCYQVFDDGTERSYVAYNADDATRTVSFSDGTSVDVAPNSFAVATGDGDEEPAAPTNLDSPSNTDTTVDLEWEHDGANTAHYNVYVDGSKYGESTDPTKTVSGLDPDTTYEFVVTAESTDGIESDPSNTIGVTTDADGDSAPSVDQFAVSDTSAGPWTKFAVEWTVSDPDGDMDLVEIEMIDDSGTVVDSTSTNVSGDSASGSDSVRERNGGGEYDVTLTVTDEVGNSASETVIITA